jgi:hypothetical protein
MTRLKGHGRPLPASRLLTPATAQNDASRFNPRAALCPREDERSGNIRAGRSGSGHEVATALLTLPGLSSSRSDSQDSANTRQLAEMGLPPEQA